MNQSSVLNWKRGVLSVATVGALTLLAIIVAKQQLVPETGDFSGGAHDGHLHGLPGPFFQDLLKVYTPRRVCMFYEPGVIWLHFISDFLIALSYFSIPVALVYFVRRRRMICSRRYCGWFEREGRRRSVGTWCGRYLRI